MLMFKEKYHSRPCLSHSLIKVEHSQERFVFCAVCFPPHYLKIPLWISLSFTKQATEGLINSQYWNKQSLFLLYAMHYLDRKLWFQMHENQKARREKRQGRTKIYWQKQLKNISVLSLNPASFCFPVCSIIQYILVFAKVWMSWNSIYMKWGSWIMQAL